MLQICFLRLYVGIETVSCYLLLQKERMDMGRNLEKLGQVLKLCLQKSPKWLTLPDEICSIFFITLQERFVYMGNFEYSRNILVYGYPCDINPLRL